MVPHDPQLLSFLTLAFVLLVSLLPLPGEAAGTLGGGRPGPTLRGLSWAVLRALARPPSAFLQVQRVLPQPGLGSHPLPKRCPWAARSGGPLSRGHDRVGFQQSVVRCDPPLWPWVMSWGWTSHLRQAKGSPPRGSADQGRRGHYSLLGRGSAGNWPSIPASHTSRLPAPVSGAVSLPPSESPPSVPRPVGKERWALSREMPPRGDRSCLKCSWAKHAAALWEGSSFMWASYFLSCDRNKEQPRIWDPAASVSESWVGCPKVFHFYSLRS